MHELEPVLQRCWNLPPEEIVPKLQLASVLAALRQSTHKPLFPQFIENIARELDGINIVSLEVLKPLHRFWRVASELGVRWGRFSGVQPNGRYQGTLDWHPTRRTLPGFAKAAAYDALRNVLTAQPDHSAVLYRLMRHDFSKSWKPYLSDDFRDYNDLEHLSHEAGPYVFMAIHQMSEEQALLWIKRAGKARQELGSAGVLASISDTGQELGLVWLDQEVPPSSRDEFRGHLKAILDATQKKGILAMDLINILRGLPSEEIAHFVELINLHVAKEYGSFVKQVRELAELPRDAREKRAHEIQEQNSRPAAAPHFDTNQFAQLLQQLGLLKDGAGSL